MATKPGKKTKPEATTISKSQAVRDAMTAGHDMPASGVPYVLETYGIEVTPMFFLVDQDQRKAEGRREAGG